MDASDGHGLTSGVVSVLCAKDIKSKTLHCFDSDGEEQVAKPTANLLP